MTARRGLLGQHVSAGVLALLLGGCAVHYQGLTTYGGEQASQWKWYTKPASGEFLCLTVPPGTPIHQHPRLAAPVVGYTRDVVAFYGLQEGRMISILMVNSVLGWIDGTVVGPYGDVHPGHTRVVWRNPKQTPVFYRN